MTKDEWLRIYSVVGAAMEVYNTLGRGMHELIYQEAFESELISRNIPYEREKDIVIYYKNRPLKKRYTPDFSTEGIVIEIKSTGSVISDFRAQLFNYLRAAKRPLGILINFGEHQLRAERYQYTPETDDFVLLTQENYKNYITD